MGRDGPQVAGRSGPSPRSGRGRKPSRILALLRRSFAKRPVAAGFSVGPYCTAHVAASTEAEARRKRRSAVPFAARPGTSRRIRVGAALSAPSPSANPAGEPRRRRSRRAGARVLRGRSDDMRGEILQWERRMELSERTHPSRCDRRLARTRTRPTAPSRGFSPARTRAHAGPHRFERTGPAPTSRARASDGAIAVPAVHASAAPA